MNLDTNSGHNQERNILFQLISTFNQDEWNDFEKFVN